MHHSVIFKTYNVQNQFKTRVVIIIKKHISSNFLALPDSSVILFVGTYKPSRPKQQITRLGQTTVQVTSSQTTPTEQLSTIKQQLLLTFHIVTSQVLLTF